MTQPGDITALLRAWTAGDPTAGVGAFELAYADLQKIAENRIRYEADGISIDATGLAHEAFLRLVEQQRVAWENRSQFFAIAARVMRRILVDRHRARTAGKRGGGGSHIALSLHELEAPVELDLDALDQALTRLADQDPRQAQIVELRFFGGLTNDDTAETLNVSSATVKREWAIARAWLKRELEA